MVAPGCGAPGPRGGAAPALGAPRRLRRPLARALLPRAGPTGVFPALGAGSWQRAHVFTDVETLWRATLATEPDAWLAHTNLGNLVAERGHPDDGIEHHRRAVAIYPDAFESNNALGNYLVRQGDLAGAKERFDRALRARPDDPLTYNNLGAMAGIAGDLRTARQWFEMGHGHAPESRDLLRNLSMLLSVAPDPALRDGERALGLARQLNALAGSSVLDEFTLFRAMLLAGDRREAIDFGQRVLDRARREHEEDIVRRIVAQLDRLSR